MTKPIYEIAITTLDQKSAKVKAVFDSGSFNSIIREDKVPAGTNFIRYQMPHEFGTAAKGGKLTTIGEVTLIMTIGEKMIDDRVLIAPELGREMLVGARTMQSWDITIQNKNGNTKIVVGHDMRDPDITEVL